MTAPQPPTPQPAAAQPPTATADAVGHQTGRQAAQRAGAPGGGRRSLGPWKAGFFVLALAGIIAAVAWALVGSRFLVVRSVQVTGLHRVARSQVLTAAAIAPGLPLIRVDTAAVAHRVEAITQVESARVSRNWPNTIVINVTERTPALAVRDGGRYDLIDRFGVAVVSVASRPHALPLYVPSGQGRGGIHGSTEVAATAAVTRELPAQLLRRLRSVTAPAADEVTLRLKGGVTVMWGSPGGAAAKARVLRILLRTHAHYYDVSSPTIATTR